MSTRGAAVGANTSTVVRGFVDAGSIQVFEDSLPEQQKEDVLNWILFGQLAADKAAENAGYSRVSDPQEWYKLFIGFLNRVAMQSDSWERHLAASSSLEGNAAQTALKLLKPYLTSNEQLLIDRVFDDLRLPLNATALKTFSEAASSESGANFLLLGASVDEHLNLTIRLASMDFHIEPYDEHENVLFRNWDRDRVKCYYGKDTLTPRGHSSSFAASETWRPS